MDDNAARFVGEIPTYYDSGLGPVLFAHYAAETAARVAALEPKRVLETAAGTGIVSAALSTALDGVEIVVTDLNGPMLAVARSRLRGMIRVEEADAQALPYPDGEFDAVVCQFGLMFLPDLAAGFREARRVLRPDGTFLFGVWDSLAHNRFAALVDEVLGELFGPDKPAFYQVPFHLSSVDALRDLAQSCGFGRITVEVLPHRAEVVRWERFVAGLVRGNPLYDQLVARGASPAEVEATVQGRLEREYGAAPTELPMQAILYAADPL